MSNKIITFENVTEIHYNSDTKFIDVSIMTDGKEKTVHSSTLTSIFDKSGHLGLDAKIIEMVRFKGTMTFHPDASKFSSIKKYIDVLEKPETKELIEHHCFRIARLFNKMSNEAKSEFLFLDSCHSEVIKFKKIRDRRIHSLCIKIAELIDYPIRERIRER